MDELSVEQVAAIDHALAENRVSSVCLSCGDKQLETENRLHGLTFYAGTTDAAPEVIMCAARICKHCGYVQYYSLAPLGLDSTL